MFDDLDALLKTRKKPDVPEYLSARIIAAAHRNQVSLPQSVIGTFQELWVDVQNIFELPRPAYAVAGFALLFVIGVLLGTSADLLSALPGMTADDLASFMLINDGFVAGEWV